MSASSRKYSSKRQRACDFCRSRKTACRIEGQLPCRICALHGRQCTFLEAAQPRKRPATLTSGEDATSRPELHHHQSPMGESNSGDLIDDCVQAVEVPPLDQQHGMSTPSALLGLDGLMNNSPNQDLIFGGFEDQFFGSFGDGMPGPQHGQAYSNTGEEPSPENYLARMDTRDSSNWLEDNLTEILLDNNENLNPQVLGYTGDMDPYLLLNYRFNQASAFKFKQLTIQSASQGKFPVQFLLSQPGLFSLSRKEMGLRETPLDVARQELETLVSADTGLRLIELFRKFILPQCPIFSESCFPDTQSTPPYLLAAIYIVAQPFARFDDILSIELAYEALNNKALFRLVNEALQYEAHNPSLDLVQTMILLILRPSINPLILESSFKWSLHGMLVTTAQNLGLHYDPSSWNIARWQIALRRRISCTIFVIDKWIALGLGKSPLVTPDAWLVTAPTTTDSYASSLDPDLWDHFTRYVNLGVLLGDVLLQLFSLRAIHMAGSKIEDTLETSKQLLGHLSDWQKDFQQSFDLSSGAKSLQTITTLGHHYVQMTIFRAIMRPFLSTDFSNQVSREHLEILGFARTGVRSATTAAASFVKSLDQDHFHIFWPQWTQVAFSSICFFDLMMATSSSDVQEAVVWFQDLLNARKEMRLKSNILPALRLGLLRIDAVFWKGVGQVVHLQPHVQQALETIHSSNARRQEIRHDFYNPKDDRSGERLVMYRDHSIRM